MSVYRPGEMVDTQMRNITLALVDRGGQYHPRFKDWLTTHWHIWETFRDASHRLRDVGVRGTSANVVTGLLRYKALFHKWENFTFTNTFNPDLARLYNELHPVGLFKVSTRSTSKGDDDGT